MDRSDCSTAANDQADEAHVEDCLDTNHDARAGGTSTAEKQCRICFSGPEEEDALGRLISPCMCTGSMRVSTELVFILVPPDRSLIGNTGHSMYMV